MGDVEEEGAGGFLHVHGVLAGEAEADVILGAEDVTDLVENFGLVVADPEELGEGEVGEGRVGDEIDELGCADCFDEPVGLGLGALIAPDEGWAEDFAGFVEHDAAVHLAGEGEGFDGLGVAGVESGLEGAADGDLGGAPPVFGVLLGPADVLGVDGGVVGGVRGEDASRAVDEEGAGSAGADVDSEKHGGGGSLFLVAKESVAERGSRE